VGIMKGKQEVRAGDVKRQAGRVILKSSLGQGDFGFPFAIGSVSSWLGLGTYRPKRRSDPAAPRESNSTFTLPTLPHG